MATLKVTIAGKEFPLTVDQDTHDQVLEAAAMINQKIEEHQQQFKVDEKDALAMCSLELATLNSQLQRQAQEWQHAHNEIEAIHATLQNAETI